jgi:hypothetical protein
MTFVPAGFNNGRFGKGSASNLVTNQTFVVNFGDLSAAALTRQITLYTPTAPGAFQISISSIGPSIAGVGTTTLTFSLGFTPVGTEAALIAAYDAMGAGYGQQSTVGFVLPGSAGIGVTLTATSTIQNLDQLSAGQWLVRIAELGWDT